MRITNAMMINDLVRNLNTNMRHLDDSQRQLSTGRKINKPSDNPSGLVKDLRLRTVLNENEQYQANIDDSLSFLETTDSAMNSMNEVLQRVRELAVKAANGSNAPDDLEAISTEIGELTEQIKTLANSTYGSKYIFAGSNVTQQPCDGPTWKGNNRGLETEIGTGVTIDRNIDMTGFFGNPSGVDAGGNPDGGIFDIMSSLQTAIDAGAYDTVSGMISDVDAKIDDLQGKRSIVGARVNRMELQQNRLEDAETSLTGLLGDVEDADIEQVIVNLKTQENVYKASLAAGARIIQPTLVDYLS